jgi:hypothetical protein
MALTPVEKSVIKALLQQGWRNQDIQALINTGRAATINSGRITGVKNDAKIKAATNAEVVEFRRRRALFDHQTGLDPFSDERLVRAREAMILAVELFNTPRTLFGRWMWCARYESNLVAHSRAISIRKRGSYIRRAPIHALTIRPQQIVSTASTTLRIGITPTRRIG